MTKRELNGLEKKTHAVEVDGDVYETVCFNDRCLELTDTDDEGLTYELEITYEDLLKSEKQPSGEWLLPDGSTVIFLGKRETL